MHEMIQLQHMNMPVRRLQLGPTAMQQHGNREGSFDINCHLRCREQGPPMICHHHLSVHAALGIVHDQGADIPAPGACTQDLSP